MKSCKASSFGHSTASYYSTSLVSCLFHIFGDTARRCCSRPSSPASPARHGRSVSNAMKVSNQSVRIRGRISRSMARSGMCLRAIFQLPLSVIVQNGRYPGKPHVLDRTQGTVCAIVSPPLSRSLVSELGVSNNVRTEDFLRATHRLRRVYSECA